MNTLKLRPKRYKILDPDTHEYLPEEGGVVEHSLYWLRRLEEGSVERVEEEELQSNPEDEV